MTTEYYRSTPSGYERHLNVGHLSVDHSKQIPVYKVVHEFMNYTKKQVNQNLEVIDENIDNTSEINSKQGQRLVSMNQPLQRTRNYIYIKSSQMLDREEVNSINLEDISSSHLKIKDHEAVRDSMISTIKTVRNKKENNHQHEQNQYEQNRTCAESELEKERTIRRNLEKSYRSLLSKLNQRQRSNSVDYIQNNNFKSQELLSKVETGDKSTENNEKHQINSHQSFDISNIMNKASKRQKNNKKVRYSEDEEFIISKKPNYSEKGEDEQDQAQYIADYDHFDRINKFNQKLLVEIDELHNKIDNLEEILEERMRQMQSNRLKEQLIEKQKIISALKLENQQKGRTDVEVKCSNPLLTGQISSQFHYLFTILVMFLMVALMTKKN